MKTRFFLFGYHFFLVLIISSCDKSIDPDNNLLENSSEYAACMPGLDESTFDIATWNIRFYPVSVFQRSQVIEIINALNADLIALQEITSEEDFKKLVELLDGWEGFFSSSGDLNLAYLYKTSEVTLGEPEFLFLDELEPFPRPAAFVEATHVNGISTSLINIHLKCCGGERNNTRRTQASEMLKDYVDQNLPDENVMIIGDWNDLIYSSTGTPSPFQNFIDDSDYLFVDMDLAKDPQYASYPSLRSHIDHILVTNELFDEVLEAYTLELNDCSEYYLKSVSDHLPVMVKLSK